MIDWNEVATYILVRLEWLILAYFLFVNTFYAVLLTSATFEMRWHLRRGWHQSRWRLLSSEVAPSVSMLAPAFNEEATITESVWSLLTLEYSGLEVVIVNDGSTDDTLDVLVREFDMVPVHPIYRKRLQTQPIQGIYRSRIAPNLIVVDKANGGKADALNAGLDVASGELVCAMDADTVIEPDALLRMVRPFLRSDEVVATGGTIRIANGSVVKGGRVLDTRAPSKLLPGAQAVEYTRAFLFGRLGWNRLGGNLIISGAFGLFRRESVIESGGYLWDTVGEDIELVARLRRKAHLDKTPNRVEFIPDPVAWTEAPESLKILGRQRDRWHRGLSDVMWRYKMLLFNPRYRSLGMIVYPYFLFVELLGPVVEAVGLVGLIVGLLIGAVDLGFAALFALVAYGYALVLGILTLAMEEISFHRYHRTADRLRLVGWAMLENAGYRQATVVWRLRGLYRFLRKQTDWGVMTRRGFSPSDS